MSRVICITIIVVAAIFAPLLAWLATGNEDVTGVSVVLGIFAMLLGPIFIESLD